MLALKDVSVAYGAVQALTRVTLTVPAGEITAIVGANGAGKSTCLRAISGLAPLANGALEFDGAPITGVPAERRRSLGIAHVMEGRRLFGDQTVQDNLRIGGYSRLRRGDARGVATDIEAMYDRFPILRDKRQVLAATLSGGQQQMLVIAMALMSRPKLLLLDEPSLGLAPKLVEQVFQIVGDLRKSGLTVLLVEQMASLGLQLASTGYVFERGRVVGRGAAADLLRGDAGAKLSEIYLGRNGRKS